MQQPGVVIVELGSQLTLLIQRLLRELGIRSIVVEVNKVESCLEKGGVRAIILSGGAASVNDKDAPKLTPPLLRILEEGTFPILGICYGMQLIAHSLEGKVESVSDQREYGGAEISVLDWNGVNPFFANTPATQEVWASHGDTVVELPADFRAIAQSGSGGIAAMANSSNRVFGVQFHPEVPEIIHGRVLMSNFLKGVAGCPEDWRPNDLIDMIRTETLSHLGRTGKSIFGFSGGVDSTVMGAILAPVLREKLLALTINGGQLRQEELGEIRENAQCANLHWRVVQAQRRFLEELGDTTDAKLRRTVFRGVYRGLLIDAARFFRATAVIQGTLAPDRIESGATGGAEIKKHHNIGLDFEGLSQLHPLGDLFKDEVRAVGKVLGLPERIWRRQPFPGPGLFLRIIGVPVTPERLALVRWADHRVREVLEGAGVYEEISQLVVAYIGTKTVGVKGDGRVYAGSIIVRPVETRDFMTSKPFYLASEVMDEINSRLTTHPEIVRVFFDYTPKPPATTEMQ